MGLSVILLLAVGAAVCGLIVAAIIAVVTMSGRPK
jgi:hypothetical protein